MMKGNYCLQAGCSAIRVQPAAVLRKSGFVLPVLPKFRHALHIVQASGTNGTPASSSDVREAVAVVDINAAPRPKRRVSTVTSQPTDRRSNATQESGGISMGAMLGVAAVAGAAILFVMYNKFFQKGAAQVLRGTADAVAGNVEQKQLQKDAVSRLNDFTDRLRNLPSVDLSAQNLGEEGTAYVVEGLAFNLACQAADLSKNGIGKIGIAALCQVLPGCALRTLVLNTNSIGDDGAELLATALSGNSAITTLDLGQNGIGDRGAKALAEALKLNTTITRLDLSGNAIDTEGAAALAEALAVNTTLSSLSLSDNYVGDKGGLALAAALSKNTSLKELYLKGNELGDTGIVALCDALQGRDCEIKVLDIGNNSITSTGADVLARMMQTKRTLTELNLYMNDVGDMGMLKLADAIAQNKSLAVLDLGGNNVGPDGAKALAASLKGHEALRSLELGYNPLGPSGTKLIVDVAKFDLKKLDTLRLGWCKVAPAGAHHISDLLMFNATIRTLDLRGNSFGNDGAIIVARGLKSAESTTLLELDLGYNEIRDDGACAIAQALKSNPEVAPKDLKLNSNYITRFGQVALSDAVDMVFSGGKGKQVTVHF